MYFLCFSTANYCTFPLSASLHMELDEMKEAENIYRELLKRNPENWSYYRKVEECLKLGLFLPTNVSYLVHIFIRMRQSGGNLYSKCTISLISS